MDSGKLNDWIQVIGIFALVASLLFVGYQIKLTRDIAISQAFQARAETAADGFRQMAGNDRTVAAMTKLSTGRTADLTPEEMTSLRLNFAATAIIFENSFYQAKEGFLPSDHWERVRSTIESAIRAQPDLSYVKRAASNLRPEFREIFEAVIAEVENERKAE